MQAVEQLQVELVNTLVQSHTHEEHMGGERVQGQRRQGAGSGGRLKGRGLPAGSRSAKRGLGVAL